LGRKGLNMGLSYRLTMLFLLGCILASPVAACRYNVRETGFVDLGIESYRLFGYVNDATSTDLVSMLSTAKDLFRDSNIKFELVNTDAQKNHEAMAFFSSSADQSLPTAILLSPDGQTLEVPLAKTDRPFEESLTTTLEGIVSSPKRKEILKQCAEKYGVVLLIEGPDAQANSEARQALLEAAEAVRSQMEFLPKPIARAPAVVTLDANSLATEKVLLWSLATKAEDVNTPHAAVFYGRGRWIGPLFKGEQIKKENLLSILYVIGGDCECGLDFRWIQGTMLPAKCGEEFHQLAVESLGFDPENPMIKMEIGSIVGRSLGPHSYAGEPFGYQEITIESESPDDIVITDVNQVTDVNPVVEANAPPETLSNQEPNNIDRLSVLLSTRVMAGITIGILSVILVIGIAIFVRARRL